MGRLFVLLVALALSKASDPTENRNLNVQPYEGDMVLTREQQLSLEASSNPNNPFAPMHAVVTTMTSQWNNGIVPYEYDSSITDDVQAVIQSAMDEYEASSCVTFRPRTTEDDYVRFFRGSGCYSYIGRIGGSQDISIGQGCASKGIVIHEIFHALGRWHEQSRPDRDRYVQINLENVIPGFENNFIQLDSRFVTTQGVPYDYKSIMHYNAYAFSSNNQPTVVPIQEGFTVNSIGQRSGLSASDLEHIRALYCVDVLGSWSEWGAWSTCSHTCNGGTRARLRTCVGGINCEGTDVSVQNCNEESCAAPPTWSSWSIWSGCSASCGGGRQGRQRICEGGNTCVGNHNEYRDCNQDACPQPPAWSLWSSWSSCSLSCDGGIRTRTRRCLNGNSCAGVALETENCNENVDCNPPPELEGEEKVGCYLVPMSSESLTLLEGSTPDLSDNPFTRTQPVAKCGLGATSKGFNVFGVSVGYCISGSNELDDYKDYFYPGYCSKGAGGIYPAGSYTYFFMDVYKVVDVPSFTASADMALQPDVSPSPSTTLPTSTTSPSTVATPEFIPEACGSSAQSYSWLLLSAVIVFAIFLL